MYIKELRVFGFKKFSRLKVRFSDGVNIVVGDNDSGKSTLLEAIVAVINGQYRGAPLARGLSEDLFHAKLVSRYLDDLNAGRKCDPPQIIIEVVFDGPEDTVALYRGDFNSEGADESGICLRIALDKESFAEEYQLFVESGEYFGIPIEYYSCSWSTFARKAIRPVGIKFGASLIGGGNAFARSNSKAAVARIARNVLEPDDRISISQAHRRMRSNFRVDEKIAEINEKISLQANSMTRKSVSLGFEAETVGSWENGVVAMLEDIPFSNAGDGTKSIVSTELALAKSRDRKRDVVLLEEPENHLSHAKLNIFLDSVSARCEGIQLVVTTHSSFVANKLELRNLILLNGDNSAALSSLCESTWRFFRKAPGYKTLRVLLCSVSILVEGDADELILQRAYMDLHGGRLPVQDGIDVISVGTSFLRFMEIAAAVGKDVVAVTDNDGDIEALERKYEDYPLASSAGDCDHQVVSYARRLLPRGCDGRVNYNTLEPEIYESAGADALGRILGRDATDRDATLKYMESNKTDVALAIFDAKENIAYPKYILEAIDWACGKAGVQRDV